MADLEAKWMPSRVTLASSWAGHDDVEIFVRQTGQGTPLLYLHGGWGYGVYPFGPVAADLVARGFRCFAPDRAGYGRSTPLEEQPPDFHRRAADETIALLDALDLDRAVLWGHSDGAVVAAWLAILAPRRFPALVLESFHLWAQKAGSRRFFESAARDELDLGLRTQAALQADHGARWPAVVRMNGRVWVELGQAASAPHADLYGGALSRVSARTLLWYGSHDPRTEPGEREAANDAIPGSQALLGEAKHAPHSESAAWAKARPRVLDFLAEVRPQAEGA